MRNIRNRMCVYPHCNTRASFAVCTWRPRETLRRANYNNSAASVIEREKRALFLDRSIQSHFMFYVIGETSTSLKVSPPPLNITSLSSRLEVLYKPLYILCVA